MEELSGDRLAEGFIYASRYMFPTAFRKDPILDAVTEIIQSCSNYRSPFGIILLKPLCVLAQPIVKCLRCVISSNALRPQLLVDTARHACTRVDTKHECECCRKAVAPFYFTSEPKSRGSIRLKPTGEVVVDPQYLVDEQDLFDAIRGTATLVEQLNGDSYR